MLHSRPRPSGCIEPCQPSNALKPPIGAGWIHEIKHDRYRMMAQRSGDRVRLITRNGYDWSERYPAVTKALELLKVQSCLRMMPKNTGARWEITVDGKPRSYRVDRQIAIESAQYLKRKNPMVEVTTVRDFEGVDRRHTAAAAAGAQIRLALPRELTADGGSGTEVD
jgi:hypothetical protein